MVSQAYFAPASLKMKKVLSVINLVTLDLVIDGAAE